MMNRIVIIMVFVAGLYYLYAKKEEPPPPPPPPPPPELSAPPPQVIQEAELERIRTATMDSDPSVRWAAIDLLYRVGDPRAMKILEGALKMDTESQVRQNALEILRGKNSAQEILPALNDSEKDIRKAALMALGEVGDPVHTPEMLRALNDVEPDVRMQALHAIGRIQEKKMAEYRTKKLEAEARYQEELNKYRGMVGNNPFSKQQLDKNVEKIGR